MIMFSATMPICRYIVLAISLLLITILLLKAVSNFWDLTKSMESEITLQMLCNTVNPMQYPELKSMKNITFGEVSSNNKVHKWMSDILKSIALTIEEFLYRTKTTKINIVNKQHRQLTMKNNFAWMIPRSKCFRMCGSTHFVLWPLAI